MLRGSLAFVCGAACSFGSCVGQFVLTASLRSQVNPANRSEFKEVSPERCVHLPGVAIANHHNSFLLSVMMIRMQSVRRLRPRLNSAPFLRVQLPRMRDARLPFGYTSPSRMHSGQNWSIVCGTMELAPCKKAIRNADIPPFFVLSNERHARPSGIMTYDLRCRVPDITLQNPRDEKRKRTVVH